MKATVRTTAGAPPTVRHFREILLWPLQLVTAEQGPHAQRPWERLIAHGESSPWTEVPRALADDQGTVHMRHYTEFITFLPTVQRFLYGEAGRGGYGQSPIRIFSRSDVAGVRLAIDDVLPPVELAVAHTYLHFFYDIEVVILAVEVHGDDLSLATAQEILSRFGRSYPSFWEEDGRGGNCFAKVEWLGLDGSTIAVSDYEDRARYLEFVGRHHTAAVSADWLQLTWPLLPHPGAGDGGLRYRQLEYLRMPLLAYLAVDQPRELTRGDFARLAFATRPGPRDRLPFSERALRNFEEDHCLDQYWGIDDPSGTNTRFLCTGNTFVVVGDAERPYFTDGERGVLGQFRHQYFLLGLIAHFHKAALLMFRDRMQNAVSRLDIRSAESVKAFKREVRLMLEVFLRFTHRYWFYEVALQSPAKFLFALWVRHLGTASLYDEIRREVQDMAQYLDSDGLRRQANTVVRLTVVTTVGLVGTIATGFLGMNLIAAADRPLSSRLIFFALVLVVTTIATGFAIVRSKRIYDFLEALSDERLSGRTKARHFLRIFQPAGRRRG